MTGFAYAALRVFAVAVAVIVVLAVMGIVYQNLSEAADLRRYPPPGKLIDIGGRKLHLLCAGHLAGPTVVIEAGSGDDVTLWEGMVHRVSRFAHVCAYDRAGLGWSDPAPGPRSFADRARDLHALLTSADIGGPYILVGHSLGGIIVRRFAAIYPGSVAGIVLVDTVEEEYVFAPEGLRDVATIRTREWRLGWAIRLGLVRLGIALFPNRFDPLRGVPDEVHGQMTALYLRSARHFARADEMAAYAAVPQAQRKAGGFGLLGDIPLVVVSRAAWDGTTGAPINPEWQAAQDRLASLSTHSVRIVAERSGHVIQFTEPELIAGAIRRLLRGARANAPG